MPIAECRVDKQLRSKFNLWRLNVRYRLSVQWFGWSSPSRLHLQSPASLRCGRSPASQTTRTAHEPAHSNPFQCACSGGRSSISAYEGGSTAGTTLVVKRRGMQIMPRLAGADSYDLAGWLDVARHHPGDDCSGTASAVLLKAVLATPAYRFNHFGALLFVPSARAPLSAADELPTDPASAAGCSVRLLLLLLPASSAASASGLAMGKATASALAPVACDESSALAKSCQRFEM